MDMWIVKYFLLCVFLNQTLGKPYITQVFPVKDEVETFDVAAEIKPFDKFLGKLRTSFEAIFHKPDNSVERILTKTEVKPINNDVEETSVSNPTTENWSLFDDLNVRNKQITFTLDESTDQVELQDEFGEPEITTMNPNDQSPSFQQTLIQWLSSLLVLTYTTYVKVYAAFCA